MKLGRIAMHSVYALCRDDGSEGCSSEARKVS